MESPCQLPPAVSAAEDCYNQRWLTEYSKTFTYYNAGFTYENLTLWILLNAVSPNDIEIIVLKVIFIVGMTDRGVASRNNKEKQPLRTLLSTLVTVFFLADEELHPPKSFSLLIQFFYV